MDFRQSLDSWRTSFNCNLIAHQQQVNKPLNKDIQKNWLQNEPKKVYNFYLKYAFEQIEQKQDLTSIQINQNLNFDAQDKRLDTEFNEFQQILRMPIEQDKNEYIMENHSKNVKDFTVEKVKFTQEKILQVKKGEIKVLEMPNKVILEIKNQKNAAQNQTARLKLSYQKRDIVVFVDTVDEAKKLQLKIIYYKVINQFPDKKKFIRMLMSSRIQMYQKEIYTLFLSLIQQYSNKLLIYKFRIGIDLLRMVIPPNYDTQTLKKFISKWLHKMDMQSINASPKIKATQLSVIIKRNQFLLQFDQMHIKNYLNLITKLQKKVEAVPTKIIFCLKSLEFDQKINYKKPMLKIILTAHQTNHSIYRKVEQVEFTELNAKTAKQRQYFKRYYKAQMKKKLEGENYQWELFEYNKQTNQTIIKNSVIKFQLNNVHPSDTVTLKFFDGFHKSENDKKNFRTISLGQIINESKINSQIWFLLTKHHGLPIFLQFEVLYSKSLNKPQDKGNSYNSYDAFMTSIINQDSGPVEPIYHQIIKPLRISGRHSQPIFKIIHSINPGTKQSLKMFTSYIIKYYKENEQVLNEIRLIIYQFIIKDLCKLQSDFDLQIEKINYITTNTKYKDGDAGQHLYQALKIQVELHQNNPLSVTFKELFFHGLPPFYRQIFWFNILDSDTFIQLSAGRFNQIEHEQLLAEQIYFNILNQSTKTLKYQKQIQYFQKMESQNNDGNFILNEVTMAAICNVCCSVLNFTQSDKQCNLELYINYCKYQIATKLLQQNFYKYIIQQQTIPYQQEKQRKKIKLKYTQEAYSFWVSIMFFQKLMCRSLILNTTQQIKEECLTFELIVKQFLPKMYAHFISIQISVIQQSCESFLTLFSNIFVSEYLYRIWDLLVWNIIQLYDFKVLRYSILYTLYSQLESIFPQIEEYNDLIIYLRLAASLINPTDKFIELIILNHTKIQELINSKESIFVLTQNTIGEKHDTLFFPQSAIHMNIDNLDFNFQQFQTEQRQLYDEMDDVEEDDINEQCVEDTVANKIQKQRDSVISNKSSQHLNVSHKKQDSDQGSVSGQLKRSKQPSIQNSSIRYIEQNKSKSIVGNQHQESQSNISQNKSKQNSNNNSMHQQMQAQDASQRNQTKKVEVFTHGIHQFNISESESKQSVKSEVKFQHQGSESNKQYEQKSNQQYVQESNKQSVQESKKQSEQGSNKQSQSVQESKKQSVQESNKSSVQESKMQYVQQSKKKAVKQQSSGSDQDSQ